jgi:hypothetical protein
MVFIKIRECRLSNFTLYPVISRELAAFLSFLSCPGPTDSVLVLSVADDAGQGEPPHQAVPGQLREQVQPRPSRAAPGTCIAKKKRLRQSSLLERLLRIF